MNNFLYMQIKEHLEECIEQNSNNPFYKLPSENQLVIKFNVSRVTANFAINKLVEEGKVYRKQGKGTYIKHTDDSPETPGLPKNKFVAIIMPNLMTEHSNDILRGINDYLNTIFFPMVIFCTFSSELQESTAIINAVNYSCCGILYYPTDGVHYNKEILNLALSNYPIVLLDRKLVGLKLPCVSSDHFAMSFDTVARLIQDGHSTIGYIRLVNIDSTSSLDRLNGYKSALEKSDIPVSLRHIFIPDIDDPFWSEMHGIELNQKKLEFVYLHFCKFIKANPQLTAIICDGNIWGNLLRKALSTLGKQDICVALFDDAYNNVLEEPKNKMYLATQSNYKIGYEAAKKLINIISSGGNSDTSDLTIPHKIFSV